MTGTKILLLGAVAVSTLSLAGCNREGEFSPVDMWNRSRYKPLEPTEQSQGPSTSRQIPAGTVYRGQTERDKLYPVSENGMSVRSMQRAGHVRDEPNTPAQAGSEAFPGSTGVSGTGTSSVGGARSVIGAGASSAGASSAGASNENGMNRGPTGDFRVRGGGATMTSFPFPVTKVVLERGKERYDIYCAPCHGRTGTGDGMVVRRGFSQPPTFHQTRLREAPVGHYFDVITNGYGAMYPYAARVSPEDRWAITAYIRALQLSQNAKISDVPAGERANIGKPKPPKSIPGHGAGAHGADAHGGDTTSESSPTRPDQHGVTDPATAN